ncbi:interferon regulatory factor 3-like isoform X1 [Hyperolius riggenbachi]|uniref:interferon regulatory factor 3-like isoform X1 n=1 Tax=Hyperolius riggenbachi TaxID=752182 RepID=UPI0035A314A3
MPIKERKDLFCPWLLRQISSGLFDGVRWLDDGCTLFRLPWKHLNMRNVTERDYAIFKAWAIHSGHYDPNCEDRASYKTLFRCAMMSIVCKDSRDKKMFTEYKDNSGDQDDPHKIFRFHGNHNGDSAAVVTSSESHSASEVTGNLLNEVEHDADYQLRISPNVIYNTPFRRSPEPDVLGELLRGVALNEKEDGIQQALDHSQNDHVQDVPRVDQVFRPIQVPDLDSAGLFIDGHEGPLSMDLNNLIPSPYDQYTQYSCYNAHQNGHIPSAPTVGHVYQQMPQCPQLQPEQKPYVATTMVSQPCQNGFQQQGVQHAMNNVDYAYHTANGEHATPCSASHIPVQYSECRKAASPVPAGFLQESGMPKLTSWEVTVFYRGKEVHKQNVSQQFYITSGFTNTDAADFVTFPSTDNLVDQTQISYTDKILNSVGEGLLLEVNNVDYKLYATRMGSSRVFWGLSESLKSKENASQAHKLLRNEKTPIFDFSQFWQELKEYIHHQRASPDYTLYLSFGQVLFEPVKKALVVVKLVPKFCTYFHQLAQQEGASSLNTELISLQISHGSSLSSCEGFSFMDTTDLTDFPYLF